MHGSERLHSWGRRSITFVGSTKRGVKHVGGWNKECLLLWIIPAEFKPKFPNFFDQIAGGTNLPQRIFSSKQMQVYSYVSNDGFDLNRFRAIEKKREGVSTDEVKLAWTTWEADIKTKLDDAGSNNQTNHL